MPGNAGGPAGAWFAQNPEANWGRQTGDPERQARGAANGAVTGARIGEVVGGLPGAVAGAALGAGVGRRAAAFSEGRERGAQPIVERVNPAYPPPPGSGSRQDIVDMQNRLAAILQARAQAEALQGMMCADAEHHEANQGPLTEFGERTQESISATAAHEAATQRRAAANQRQQQEEANVGGTLRDYGNRAAGLSALTVPLSAVAGFTYLANVLPNRPSVLRGAKRNLLKLNTDSTNFLQALGGIDTAVADQQAGQPERTEEIAGNADRLTSVGDEAAASQVQLEQAAADGQSLATENEERASDSRQREAEAAGTCSQLDRQAGQTESEIDAMTEQWAAWAHAHRQARQAAVERTRAAMIAQGYIPREVSGA